MLTTTGKLAVERLPAGSEALHETVVVPIANTLPDAGTQLTVGVLSGSLAVTVNVTVEPPAEVACAMT